jgi:acyl carrier protein
LTILLVWLMVTIYPRRSLCFGLSRQELTWRLGGRSLGTVDPTVRPQLRSKVKNSTEIIEFLMQLVSDQSGIPKDKISPTDSLPSYGFDSIAVVRAAQNLSDFLGTSVGAIDIFTASCISELADFLVNLLHKSGPQAANQPRSKLKNSKDIVDFLIQIVSVQTGISKDKISPSDSLPSYGFDSITVVRAAQKLSQQVVLMSLPTSWRIWCSSHNHC